MVLHFKSKVISASAMLALSTLVTANVWASSLEEMSIESVSPVNHSGVSTGSMSGKMMSGNMMSGNMMSGKANSAWIKGFFRTSKQDKDDDEKDVTSYKAYDTEGKDYGASIGYGMMVSDGVTIGALAGLVKAESTLKGEGNAKDIMTDTSRYYGGVYANIMTNGLMVDVLINAGQIKSEMDFGSKEANDSLDTERSGLEISGYASAVYRLQLSPAFIDIGGNVSYSQVKQDKTDKTYTKDASNKTMAYNLVLGAGINNKVASGEVLAYVKGSVGYVDFNADVSDTAADSANGNLLLTNINANPLIRVIGEDLKKITFYGTAGVEFNADSGMYAKLTYEFTKMDIFQAHTGSAAIGFKF